MTEQQPITTTQPSTGSRSAPRSPWPRRAGIAGLVVVALVVGYLVRLLTAGNPSEAESYAATSCQAVRSWVAGPVLPRLRGEAYGFGLAGTILPILASSSAAQAARLDPAYAKLATSLSKAFAGIATIDEKKLTATRDGASRACQDLGLS